MENLENEFLELLNQESSFETYSKGDIVQGTIIKILDNLAFVDIGQKTEAVINKNEIDGLLEGTTIKAVYTGKYKDGYPLLTRKPIAIKEALEKVKNAFEQNQKLTAKVLKKLQKGYLVNIEGLKAYLPNSQTGLKEDENLPEEFEIYVINLDTSSKTPKIVISRKKVLQEEINKKRERLLNELEEGITIPVKVLKITKKGAVVSIGDLINGFLPASLYSWDKNKSINELQEGQEINLMVKSIDKENKKIILSKRDLEPNPWKEFKKEVGDKVKAKVKSFNDYGIIVEVEGLEGFIPKSHTHYLYPNKFKKIYKEGQEVEAVIIELDRDKRTLKLSITKATKHPLDEFLENNPEGSIVEGKIKSVKNKVAFVDLGDIEGILHLEDATWNPKIKTIKQVLKGKSTLKFKVLGKEKNKIRLGLKQLKENPWESFLSKHKLGDYVEGKVVKLVDKGAFVELEEDVEGFIPVREISKERIEIPSDKLSLGQEITAKIIKIKGNDIILSIKAVEKDKEKREIESILNKVKPKGEGLATLGELIKKKLQEKGG